MKKLILTMVVLTMIMTSAIMPAEVMATPATENEADVLLLYDDFEGYTSVSNMDGLVSIRANDYQGVSLVDSGDSERGQVIQLNRADNNCGIVADIIPAKQVEISAWMKVGSDSNQRFCLVCFDSTGKYMELLALYPNKNFGTNDGKDAGYDWWSGEKHAINTWYQVKAVIDLENGTAKYMLYNTEGVKLEEKSYTGVNFISDIAKVRVHNNGANAGSNYVDDLKVTKFSHVSIDEDFEGYTSVSNMDGLVSIRTNDYTGVSLIDSGDSERGQVIQLNRADASCGIVADIAPVKQVEISAWMKVGSDSNQRFCLVCFDSTGKYMELLALYPNKNFGTNDGKDAGYDWWSGEKHAINTWYRVKADIDLENDTATYMLYNTAGVKLEEKSYTGVDFISDIAKVRVHNNGSNSGSNYVDDLVVKQKGYTSERVLKNETFENGNMFVSSNASYPTRTEFDVTRNTTIGIIPYNETGVGQIVGTGNLKDVYEGSVRIGYDLYLSKDGYVTLKNKKDQEIPLLHFAKTKISTVIESGDLGHLPTENWYHFEHLLDLDHNLQKVKVYNQNGELVASGINEDLNGVNDIQLNIDKVEVRNWSAGSQTDVKFDNFKYETYAVDRPEVTGVSMTDIYGKTVEGLSQITPDIASIVITYDKDLSQNNLSRYFNLKKADGTKVEYTASREGNVYKMNLTNALDGNASYILKAAAQVLDVDGIATGEALEVAFTTGARTNHVEIISAEKKDGKIIAKVGYSNTNIENLPLEYIVGFYGEEGALLSAQVVTETDMVDACGVLTKTFDDYAGKETVKETRIFIWNTLIDMEPYGDFVLVP